MRRKLRLRYFYLPAVFFTAAFLTDANYQSGTATEVGVEVSSGAIALPNIAGTWQGRWTDTRFSVTDSLAFSIAVNGSDVTGTGTLGMMNAFALPNEAGTISGTITGNQLSFTFTTNTATGGGTLIDNDVANGVGSIGGVLGFGGYTFTGTVDDMTMRWEFDFDDPAGGNGRVVLSHLPTPVETSTLGEIKAKHAE